MTTTQEVSLFSLEIPKKAVLKLGTGLIFIDGFYHILEGMGFFTTIPGAESMPMGEFVAATQAIPINWMVLGWGVLITITAIMLYRHISKE